VKKNKYFDLLALSLGDGYLQDRRNNGKAIIDIANHISNSDFVILKSEILKRWGIKFKLRPKQNSNGTKFLRCFSRGYRILGNIQKKLYKNGMKTFRYHWGDHLNEEHLAILWFDDGCLIKTNNYIYGELSTQSFDKKGNENILRWFKKFNIEGYIIYSKKRNFYYIRFNRDNVKKICDLVRPYAPESMLYKVSY